MGSRSDQDDRQNKVKPKNRLHWPEHNLSLTLPHAFLLQFYSVHLSTDCQLTFLGRTRRADYHSADSNLSMAQDALRALHTALASNCIPWTDAYPTAAMWVPRGVHFRILCPTIPLQKNVPETIIRCHTTVTSPPLIGGETMHLN